MALRSNARNGIDVLQEQFEEAVVPPQTPPPQQGGASVGSSAIAPFGHTTTVDGVAKRYFVWGRDTFDNDNTIFF